MSTMTATEARNKIGNLWESAAKEPVTVMSAGKAVAVVVSPDDYEELVRNARAPHRKRPVAQAGFAKHLFPGLDVDALLATPIAEMFEGYL